MAICAGIRGPIAGAFVVVGIENWLAELGAWVTIIQGLIFMAVVQLFHKGIIGEALAYFEGPRNQ